MFLIVRSSLKNLRSLDSLRPGRCLFWGLEGEKIRQSLFVGNLPGNLLDPGAIDLQDRGDLLGGEDSLEEELLNIFHSAFLPALLATLLPALLAAFLPALLATLLPALLAAFLPAFHNPFLEPLFNSFFNTLIP